MTKQAFIDSLQDKIRPAVESKHLLEKLKQENFSFLEEDRGTEASIKPEHLWDDAYYNAHLIDFRADLPSYARCEHIIKIKEYLQKGNFKGFVAPKQAVEFADISAKNPDTSNYSAHKQDNKMTYSYDLKKLLNNFNPEPKYRELLQKKNVEKLRLTLLADLNNTKIDFETVLKTGLYLEQQCQNLFEDYGVSLFYPIFSQ